MLVHRFKEFIKSLSDIKNKLSESDLEFLALLQEKHQLLFSAGTDGKLNETTLNKDDFDWIEQLFAARWQKVADHFDDYTFDSGGVNAPWVSFAKELAVDLQKSYLSILIPVIANTIEPNNFLRLDQAPDVRSIYLSNDNTWHQLHALYEELKKPVGVFGILDKPKSVLPRPLTLNELNRIRSKKGDDLEFKDPMDLTSYSSFWDYVKRKIAPTWQDNGACSTYLLPPLLKLIERYFAVKTQGDDFKLFHDSFNYFAVYLATCPLAEVNNFYGASIQGIGKSYFLIEILLDCLQGDQKGLGDKLLNVAKWICQVDPSLVSQNESIKPVYVSLKAGSNFNLKFLQELVADLNVSTTNLVKPLQIALLRDLDLAIKADKNNEKETPVPIVSKLKAIYALRWNKIVDTPLDYTRVQNGVNLSWMRLAQHLAGAGYIDANYYKLLMPTLRQDYDVLSGDLLTTYPLSKYILSRTDQELIHLPDCMGHHKAKGTFYNCNYREPMPLSHKERKRLAYADPEIYAYFSRIDEKLDDPPLSKRTVDAVRKLVNGSLNPSGLFHLEVSKSEDAAATNSYLEFSDYVSKLDDDEKNRLYRHRILWRSYLVSVQEILDLVQFSEPDKKKLVAGNSKSVIPDKRECVAGHGKYFAQLVMDYASETKFRVEIEQQVDIAGMRASSAKKVYSDYHDLTEEEAVRRILILTTSLMTHSFQYLWFTSAPLTFGNHINNVTDTGKEIFELVKASIEVGDFKHARFLYGQLMEHIVKPAVTNKSWIRFPDTDNWLNSIRNGSMFNAEKAVFFDPELLLTVLWSMSKENNRLKPIIENFLDELHKILITSDNSDKKWIQANIEFANFLNNELIFPRRSTIIQELRFAEKNPVDPEAIIQISKEFLIHRLAIMGAQQGAGKQAGFFGVSPGLYKASHEYFRNLLDEKLVSSMSMLNDESLSLKELVAKLHQIVGAIEKKEVVGLLHYLQQVDKELIVTAPTQRIGITCQTG